MGSDRFESEIVKLMLPKKICHLADRTKYEDGSK